MLFEQTGSPGEIGHRPFNGRLGAQLSPGLAVAGRVSRQAPLAGFQNSFDQL
jgi:hypothetical protein